MPYISKEKVKEIRNELKKTFPKVKFSVRKDNSSVDISIMESPFDFGENTNVNHYYINDHFEDKKQAEFLQKVSDIATNGQKQESFDGDYGSIPNYYVSIRIGKWNKPHKTIVK